MKKILSFFILSLLTISSIAQVPNTFHFQGALKDSDGIPVTDTKFIEFRIYDAETDGNLLWNEGPVAVEILNGLFSLELGGTVPFPEGFFDNSPLYLTFALASGEMEPRQKLLSVPYALKAASSDEDWQISGNYIINLNDSIGIGTADPKTRFEVNAIMRLTPAGMTEICDITLEGSIYYDMNLKEYCFCDGINWQQLDGGGYCECVDLDGDGADICDPGHPYDTDGLVADCDDGNNEVYPGNLEYCDGIDNDCNPNTPDGSSETTYGDACDGFDNDLCEEGTIICLAGTLACSDFTGDNEELCDGIDNDCDGDIDEDLVAPPNSNQNGVCGAGYQICTGSGGWVDDYSSIPEYEQTEVSCDGLDNDCDGEIDEVCACTPGQTQPCGSSNLGECVYGTQTCDGSGQWGTCIGAVEPIPEDCNGLDDDCDGDYDEDFDLLTDTENCGACGNVCSALNATSFCSDGICEFICDPGYDDCDGDPLNGCETNLNNDDLNCGTCGNICDLPNATSICNNGMCEINTCNTGWDDCDGDPSNGCETDLNDDLNCGTCGNDCGVGYTCIDGQCEPL